MKVAQATCKLASPRWPWAHNDLQEVGWPGAQSTVHQSATSDTGGLQMRLAVVGVRLLRSKAAAENLRAIRAPENVI